MKMKEWAICAVVIIFNDFTMWYKHGDDCTPQVNSNWSFKLYKKVIFIRNIQNFVIISTKDLYFLSREVGCLLN